jgi:hypothetical protein
MLVRSAQPLVRDVVSDSAQSKVVGCLVRLLMSKEVYWGTITLAVSLLAQYPGYGLVINCLVR